MVVTRQTLCDIEVLVAVCKRTWASGNGDVSHSTENSGAAKQEEEGGGGGRGEGGGGGGGTHSDL